MMNAQLLFVYNANRDLFSTVTDFAHKILSPATYQCRLCALTYGHFTIKQEWKSFIRSLPVATVFLHQDEFEKKHTVRTGLPSVFLSTNGVVQKVISKQEIESCRSLDELKTLVIQKIHPHVQHHHSDIQ